MPASFDIALKGVGKKFNRNWLFKDLDLSLGEHKKIALVGTNGSGKSTLLRIIAAQSSPSVGKVQYFIDGKKIPQDQVYQHISWMGPYIEVFPELTLEEQFRLHFKFKTPLLSSIDEMIKALDLWEDKDKLLNYYSSGMLQRAKVGMAIFTQSKVLMLDEPTSNMDKENARKILELIDKYLGDRILIMASNMEREYEPIAYKLKLGRA